MSQESQVDKTISEELVLADWLEDETVPAGWSHRTVPGSRKVLVRDPSGRKHDGRRKAILHLLKSKEDRERDLAVSVLRAGLEVEGWRTEQSLPPGWRCRLTSREKKYLSENLTLFTSNIKALEFAEENYEEATVEKFRNLTQHFSQRNSSSTSLLENSAGQDSELTDCEGDDETVPAGWTTRPGPGASLIISPSGQEFTSRLAGLRSLVESGAPDLVVEEMAQFLYYEQWQDDPDLPTGWKLKLDQAQGKLLFLTSQAEVLLSLLEAFSHLQQGGYSQEALIRLNSVHSRHQPSLQTQVPVELSPNTTELSTEQIERTEKTLPPGWKLKELSHITKVEAPDGTVYRSRRVALQNMIETGRYPQQEIDLMRKYLKFERWSEQESLPSGWMIKRRKKNLLLMARDGMLFESIAQALEFVQTYSLYFDDDDIDKIKKLAGVAPATAPVVPERVETLKKIKSTVRRSKSGSISTLNDSWSSDPSLPAGWKVKKRYNGRNEIPHLLSPAGEYFKNVRLALKHLIDSNGAVEEIAAVREYLKSQGWKEGFDKLPALWFYKTGNTGRKISFLTDAGDFLEHKVNAISYLNQRSTPVEEDVKKLKAFCFDDIAKPGENQPNTSAEEKVEEIKPEAQKPKKSKKPGIKSAKKKITEPDESWTVDDSVPEGWRQKWATFGAGGKVQLLLTPSGDTFRGKREALRWMLKNTHSQEQISQMRNLLPTDGWKFHERLPQNWLYKKEKNGKGRFLVTYCSPSGDYLKSREKAVKFARDTGVAESEVKLLSSFSVKGNERKPADVTTATSLSEEISLTETDSSFDSLSETETLNDSENSHTSLLSDQSLDESDGEIF